MVEIITLVLEHSDFETSKTDRLFEYLTHASGFPTWPFTMLTAFVSYSVGTSFAVSTEDVFTVHP